MSDMPDQVFRALSSLREEYREKMNRSVDAAQQAAQTEEMDLVSMHSTESERYREAFHALNRAVRMIDEAFAVSSALQPSDSK